uniref:Phosphagen kinase N-terminal domain-containing protein n=1 Tax=Palpitomonas bilix TaxID=652834 RepID=A0A7S3DE65_9EUKA|mmetsp:Transcript_33471/g.85579  ORF Transcript_33471/g.85579 Transcript_33471/m.85579 type:complete len:574 (+) Transcript_33471:62-1783(+)
MGCGASRGDKQSEVVVDTRQDNAAPPVNLPGYPAELVASKALVADVLTEMLFNKLRTRSSDTGFTILDLVAPAYSSPQNKYGIVAGDASCFHSSAFRDVLLPVIEKAHGKPKPSGIYEGATSSTKAATDAVNAVTELDYVQMIRFEASRNLPDRRFVQAFSGSDEIGVEEVLKQKLERSADRYEGLYTTVGSLAPAERQMMDRLGFLPESDSTPMLSPRGKGVFVSGGRDLAVVVNGKDHVKVITQCVRNWEDGRFIFGVCNRSAGACQVSSEYNRLKDALATIFDNFSFAFDPQLGWLGGDLDRIGTSLSGHLGLSPENLLKAMTDNDQKPKISAAFDAICTDLGLKWKEDKTREGEGFIRMWFESSLGRSEIDCVQSLLDAVKRVVDLDTSFGLTPEEVEAEKLIDSFQQELLSARKEGDEEGNEEIKSNEAVAVGKAEAENDNNVHIEKADAELVDKVLSGTTSLEGALGKKAEVLEFIHFNDVYNIEPRENEPVGGAARFVGKLKELKQENENMLVFFSGDAFNPSMSKCSFHSSYSLRSDVCVNLSHFSSSTCSRYCFSPCDLIHSPC